MPAILKRCQLESTYADRPEEGFKERPDGYGQRKHHGAHCADQQRKGRQNLRDGIDRTCRLRHVRVDEAERSVYMIDAMVSIGLGKLTGTGGKKTWMPVPGSRNLENFSILGGSKPSWVGRLESSLCERLSCRVSVCKACSPDQAQGQAASRSTPRSCVPRRRRPPSPVPHQRVPSGIGSCFLSSHQPQRSTPSHKQTHSLPPLECCSCWYECSLEISIKPRAKWALHLRDSSVRGHRARWPVRRCLRSKYADYVRLVTIIDIGSNLLDPMFAGVYNGKQAHEPDLQHVLARARRAGVRAQIVTSGSLEESIKSLELVKQEGQPWSAPIDCLKRSRISVG